MSLHIAFGHSKRHSNAQSRQACPTKPQAGSDLTILALDLLSGNCTDHILTLQMISRHDVAEPFDSSQCCPSREDHGSLMGAPAPPRGPWQCSGPGHRSRKPGICGCGSNHGSALPAAANRSIQEPAGRGHAWPAPGDPIPPPPARGSHFCPLHIMEGPIQKPWSSMQHTWCCTPVQLWQRGPTPTFHSSPPTLCLQKSPLDGHPTSGAPLDCWSDPETVPGRLQDWRGEGRG